jgi:serine/threonine-protein phosphatase 4 regulatory subunit 2
MASSPKRNSSPQPLNQNSTVNTNNMSPSAASQNGPPLTSDDLEEVLLELNRFEKAPTTNIPSILDRYLVFVAETGTANFPWSIVKPLFRSKLENVIVDFSTASPTDDIPPVPNVDVFNFADIRTKMFEQLDAFPGIPFTVQRLAELITKPRKHYKRTDKFMRALEKNMLIVSTVEARAKSNGTSEYCNTR